MVICTVPVSLHLKIVNLLFAERNTLLQSGWPIRICRFEWNPAVSTMIFFSDCALGYKYCRSITVDFEGSFPIFPLFFAHSHEDKRHKFFLKKILATTHKERKHYLSEICLVYYKLCRKLHNSAFANIWAYLIRIEAEAHPSFFIEQLLQYLYFYENNGFILEWADLCNHFHL